MAPVFNCTSEVGIPRADDDINNTGGIGKNILTGGIWVNTSTDEVWICMDNTSGSAVWKKVLNEHILTTSTDLYFSPISGSDATGDGTTGNPFASPHKCIESLPYIINANVNIYCKDTGTHDLSSYGDLYVNKRGIGGFRIYIKPDPAIVTPFTTLDSGTFTGTIPICS